MDYNVTLIASKYRKTLVRKLEGCQEGRWSEARLRTAADTTFAKHSTQNGNPNL